MTLEVTELIQRQNENDHKIMIVSRKSASECTDTSAQKSRSAWARKKSATDPPKSLETGELIALIQGLVDNASSSGRLVTGLEACSRLFEERPNEIAMCILPVKVPSDAMLNICFTLIKAHCLERGVLQVLVNLPVGAVFVQDWPSHSECFIVKRNLKNDTEARVLELLRGYASSNGNILVIDRLQSTYT